jgi:hypothetical protein
MQPKIKVKKDIILTLLGTEICYLGVLLVIPRFSLSIIKLLLPRDFGVTSGASLGVYSGCC